MNYAQSFKWLTKSAASGNPRAKLDLGILYLNGYGVPFDYAKALSLFEQADLAGEMKAARYLGIIYERGLGVSQDYKKQRNIIRTAINIMILRRSIVWRNFMSKVMV